ncbi:MAG: hypothetical protein ABW170_20240 [Candidatus Thiodiazotropha sp. L084R]
MPYIAPYRSQLRPYNHAYAYRGLTAFATLSMAVSVSKSQAGTQQQAKKDQAQHRCNSVLFNHLQTPINHGSSLLLQQPIIPRAIILHK